MLIINYVIPLPNHKLQFLLEGKIKEIIKMTNKDCFKKLYFVTFLKKIIIDFKIPMKKRGFCINWNYFKLKLNLFTIFHFDLILNKERN